MEGNLKHISNKDEVESDEELIRKAKEVIEELDRVFCF